MFRCLRAALTSWLGAATAAVLVDCVMSVLLMKRTGQRVPGAPVCLCGVRFFCVVMLCVCGAVRQRVVRHVVFKLSFLGSRIEG